MEINVIFTHRLNYIIGDKSFKAEHQFLNISLLLGSFFFLFFLLLNVYFKVDLTLGYIKLTGFILGLTLYYFSRFQRLYLLTSNIFFSSLIASYFIIGIKNGGVTGGIAPVYTAILALMLFITKGRSLKVLFAFWVVCISALFYLEYFHPEQIKPYLSRDQKYLDLYLSYLSSIAMIAMVVVLVKRLYIKEKLNLEEMLTKYRDYSQDIKNSISVNKKHLSFREREICDNVLMGLTNREIAEKLFISEGTVKSHINKIYKKLGTKKRIEVLEYY